MSWKVHHESESKVLQRCKDPSAQAKRITSRVDSTHTVQAQLEKRPGWQEVETSKATQENAEITKLTAVYEG